MGLSSKSLFRSGFGQLLQQPLELRPESTELFDVEVGERYELGLIEARE